MHYKADGGWDRYPDRFRGGSLFGFSSTTQTSTFTESPTGKLFSVQSTTTFSAVRDEVGFSDEDLLVRGNANYIVIFNEVDRVLTFSNIEDNSRAYSYNETSIVNVEGIDYGFVNESPTLFDDYQEITDEVYYPWQIADYGFLTPDRPLFPYGVARIISTTADSQTKIYIGDGTLDVNGNAKIFVLPKHNGSGFIRFAGELVERNTENYVGSGSLFGFSSTTESTSVVEESKELFKFVGNAIEKNTENYVGSGLFSALGGSAESYGPNPEEQGELFKFFGNVIEKNTENYVGSGSLFTFTGAAERVTYHYNESSIVDIESDDYGFISEVESYQIDDGLVGDQITYPWQREDYGFLQPDTPRRPFGKFEFVSTTDESFAKANYTGSGFIAINGLAKVYVLPKHNGSGFIRFSGDAIEKNTEDYVGSGSLFGFSSTTESTSNAETSKELFRFSGNAVEKNTENYVGSGSLFGFSSTTESYGPNPEEQGELFRFSGNAVEKNTENYVGSGSLFGFVGAAERVTYHYNESSIVDIESDDYGFITETPLFGSSCDTISDYSDELISTYADEIVSEFGCVDVGTDYGLVGDQITYPWQREDYGFIIPDAPRRPYGKFEFVSNTTEAYSKGNYTGSGTLFGFSSTTEATSVQAESKGLFRISGSAAESTTPTTEIGSGSIFSFVSFTETAVYNPPESTELFKINGEAYVLIAPDYPGSGTITISGEARIYVLPKHNGSGFITIFGNGAESTTPQTEVGSGSIFTFVSFTETAVFNPAESTELFRITGSAIEKSSPGPDGSGTIELNGSATTIFRLKVTETGREPIKVTGNATESTTPATEIGSGSLFGFSSTTESTSNAETSKELFKFSGTAVEKNTENYVGSGNANIEGSATTIFRLKVTETGREPIRITGDVIEKNTESYLGSGSLFGFSSTTESTSNAETSKELFKFSGTATELVSYNPPEVGEFIKLSGTAVERNTESYLGTGSLFGFSGASESISNAETSRELFRFSGKGQESTTPAPHIGSGSIFTFVSFTESTSVSEVSTELFRFSGTAEEKNTESYIGTGSLFGFSSTTEASGSNPPESTILFRFSGKGQESTTPAPHVGSGSIFTFVSFTETRSVSEVSAELFRFSGTAEEKNTEAYRGTGLITSIGSKSTTIFRVRVISDGSLLRINGNLREAFAYGLYNGYDEIQISGESRDRKIKAEPKKPPRIYVI
jgi:hypothetical protein